MTLIAGVKGDEFYITMNCGAQEEARKLGVDLDFQGPDQFDASLQTPIVNAVAAHGLSKRQSSSVVESVFDIIFRCFEKGEDVKIVGFDAGPKQVKDLEDGLVQALIAQKPAEIGRLAGHGRPLARAHGVTCPLTTRSATDFIVARSLIAVFWMNANDSASDRPCSSMSLPLARSMYRGQFAKSSSPAGSWFARDGFEASPEGSSSLVPSTPHAASRAVTDRAPAPIPILRSRSRRVM